MNNATLVERRQEGGVLTLTLADEANRNALSPQLVSELLTACDEADADATVRVVVLTNRGRVFCAGANLKQHASDNADGADLDPRSSDPTEIFGRFRRSPKPYVGRIAGHCVAGGMGLAAAMDISIASDDVRFGFTEVRVGVIPAVISVVCLPKMRPADAREAFLRGHRFSATDAAAMGLINRAVPADSLDTEVGEVLADLLAGGPEALAGAKELLAQVPTLPFDQAMAWTKAVSADRFASAEAAEGMAAFLDKRLPSWAPSPDALSPGEDH